MKKLVLILTMCIMHFLSYAQEPVFAYDNNQIKSKPQFIEAVNNAIFYGNKLDSSKHVKFSVYEEEKRLFVAVKDEGEGFDYSYIPDPTLPDNIEKDAGRGLYLMKTLSDDLIFEDGGSKVTMVFNL